MDSQTRNAAEARLTQAFEDLRLDDPRPVYRERLKRLRTSSLELFQQAVSHYENVVLPALLEGDVVASWLDYGRYLAGLDGTGTLFSITADGRAELTGSPAAHSLAPGTLVLFVPESGEQDVLVAAAPLQPAPAQVATLDLLVHRRVSTAT